MDTTAGDGMLDAFSIHILPSNASIHVEKSEKRALAELKNGKILFRQKPMTFEKNSETMSGA